jgi:hypothetical protein
MVKILLAFNKYGGLFSIILGGLAILGIFLPIGILDALKIITIEITPLGKISGFPFLDSVSDLEFAAGNIVLIPSILGYIMLILTIAISILGIIQLISNESKSIVILILIAGVVLILITIIQYYIFKYIADEIPALVLTLGLILGNNITLGALLYLASIEAGIGFYLVLIPTIGVLITSLIHIISIRRLAY